MIYYKNIVDMKLVFYFSRDFETTFFFSIFDNAIITIAKKKIKLFPYFGNDIAAIAFYLFILRALHTRAHSDTQNSGRKTGQWNFGNAIAEIQRFSLSSFPYSLFYFLAEFRQCHCWNSVSLLNFPIIFEQFI